MTVRIPSLALAILLTPIAGLHAQSDRQPSAGVVPVTVRRHVDKDVVSLDVTPTMNDGSTIYRLTLRDVPVDGFWSLTVYNSDGYLQPNPDNIYAVNSMTARQAPDGSTFIQFGGCSRAIRNCLSTMPGWSYVVSLYRPRPEIVDGVWTFPDAQPVR